MSGNSFWWWSFIQLLTGDLWGYLCLQAQVGFISGINPLLTSWIGLDFGAAGGDEQLVFSQEKETWDWHPSPPLPDISSVAVINGNGWGNLWPRSTGTRPDRQREDKQHNGEEERDSCSLRSGAPVAPGRKDVHIAISEHGCYYLHRS